MDETSPETFKLLITHVTGEGPFLKIFGQVDKTSLLKVEMLLTSSKAELDSNIGVIPSILKGVICVAKIDHKYYRVLILQQQDENLVTVQLVDYGSKEVIALSNIRFLNNDSKFLQIPVTVTSFYLSNFRCAAETWDPKKLFTIEEMLTYSYCKNVCLHKSKVPLISIQTEEENLINLLLKKNYGIPLTIEEQEHMLLKNVGTETKQNITGDNMFFSLPSATNTITAPKIPIAQSCLNIVKGNAPQTSETFRPLLHISHSMNYPPSTISNMRSVTPEERQFRSPPNMNYVQSSSSDIPNINITKGNLPQTSSPLQSDKQLINYLQPTISNMRRMMPEERQFRSPPNMNYAQLSSSDIPNINITKRNLPQTSSPLQSDTQLMNYLQPTMGNMRGVIPEERQFRSPPNMNYAQLSSSDIPNINITKGNLPQTSSPLQSDTQLMNYLQPTMGNMRGVMPEERQFRSPPNMNYAQLSSSDIPNINITKGNLPQTSSPLQSDTQLMNYLQPTMGNMRRVMPEERQFRSPPNINYVQSSPPGISNINIIRGNLSQTSSPLQFSTQLRRINTPPTMRSYMPEERQFFAPLAFSNMRMRAPESTSFSAPLSFNNVQSPPPSNFTEQLIDLPRKVFENTKLAIESVHKVVVNHVEPLTTNFAVLLLSDAQRLNDLMSDINKLKLYSLEQAPVIGQVCLGKYLSKGVARAVVSNVSRHGCKLYFVDFGDELLVEYHDLYEMPIKFLNIPVFAIKMCLSGVTRVWYKGIEKTFQSLVANDNVFTLCVTPPEGPPMVQYGMLYTNECDVLSIITSNLQFTFQETWHVGYQTVVFVTHVQTCVKFFVQPASEMAALRSVMDQVKSHCATSQCPSSVSVGSACCALFPGDGNWYRARVLQCLGPRVLVRYVDYGNEQELQLTDLRIITPQLMQLPAMAMKCALKGFEDREPNIDEDNLLESCILEEVLRAYVIDQYDEDTMLISLVHEKMEPKVLIANTVLRSLKPPEIKPVENKAMLAMGNSELKLDADGNPSAMKWRIFKPSNQGYQTTSQEGIDAPPANKEKQTINSPSASPICTGLRNDRASVSPNKYEKTPEEPLSSKVPSAAVTENPIRRLANPVPLHQAYLECNIEPQSEHEVNVSWIITPSSFYVQITAFLDKFMDMMNIIPDLYKGVKPYTGTINEGASVLARYPEDGVLYRATVISCKYRKYIVQYIDYGNESSVDSTDIWQLDEEIMSVPKMAIHCSLLGVAPPEDTGEWKLWGLDTCFNAPRYQCVFQQIDEERHHVSMWNNGISVADTLVEKELAVIAGQEPDVTLNYEPIDLNIVVGQEILCFVTQVDSYNKFHLHFVMSGGCSQSLECCFNNHTAECRELMTLDALREQLTGNKFIVYVNALDEVKLVVTLYSVAGDKVNVLEPDEGAFDAVTPLSLHAVFSTNFGNAFISHINTLSSLYLHRASDADALATLLDNMFMFYEEGTRETLETYKVDGLCAAKSSDGNWYRATIRSVADTECEVQFPDYGNTEQVSKDSIKKLDSQFHQPCAFALEVSLELQAVHDDATAKLIEWTTDKETQVSLSIGDNGWMANLNLEGVDLCLKLKDEFLIHQNSESSCENLSEGTSSLPNRCIQVFISHIESPGLFWLQNCELLDEINKMQEFLMVFSPDYKSVEHRELGQMCIAKDAVDNCWYRAEIVDYSATHTTVQYIDFGTIHILRNKPGNLKLCPVILAETEAFCMKCSLYIVPSAFGEWTKDATAYFTQLIGDLSIPVNASIVLKDEVTFVDLFANNQSVTDKLIDYQLSCSRSVCIHLHNCFVTHVNSPDEFWIQLQSSAQELKAMNAILQDATVCPELNDGNVGVVCAAKYENTWCRAKILDTLSIGFKVLFIDYGKTTITTELRTIPDEIKQRPILSIKCALVKPTSIREWPQNSSIFFTELTSSGDALFSFQFISKAKVLVIELYYEEKSVKDLIIEVCETSIQSHHCNYEMHNSNSRLRNCNDLHQVVNNDPVNKKHKIKDEIENGSINQQSLIKCDSHNLIQEFTKTDNSVSRETLQIIEVNKEIDKRLIIDQLHVHTMKVVDAILENEEAVITPNLMTETTYHNGVIDFGKEEDDQHMLESRLQNIVETYNSWKNLDTTPKLITKTIYEEEDNGDVITKIVDAIHIEEQLQPNQEEDVFINLKNTLISTEVVCYDVGTKKVSDDDRINESQLESYLDGKLTNNADTIITTEVASNDVGIMKEPDDDKINESQRESYLEGALTNNADTVITTEAVSGGIEIMKEAAHDKMNEFQLDCLIPDGNPDVEFKNKDDIISTSETLVETMCEYVGVIRVHNDDAIECQVHSLEAKNKVSRSLIEENLENKEFVKENDDNSFGDESILYVEDHVKTPVPTIVTPHKDLYHNVIKQDVKEQESANNIEELLSVNNMTDLSVPKSENVESTDKDNAAIEVDKEDLEDERIFGFC